MSHQASLAPRESDPVPLTSARVAFITCRPRELPQANDWETSEHLFLSINSVLGLPCQPVRPGRGL